MDIRILLLFLAAPAVAFAGATVLEERLSSGREAEWARIEAPVALALPRDHGSHPAVRTEWWYLTGLVRDEEGRRHGLQATIFRQGLDPRPAAPGDDSLRARHAWAAHVAWLDVAEGKLRHVERVRREGLDFARGSTALLDAKVDDVSMTMDEGGTIRVKAGAREEGYELELSCAPARPWTRHGADGTSRKGPEPGNASMYLSATRLATTGVLRRLRPDGTWSEAKLAGECWFDHEWGSSQLGEGVVGWDWLGLRLADGRDLMLYRLRTKEGGVLAQSSGTLVHPDGRVVHLAREDFAIEELAHWTSPRTKGRWPVRLSLAVPAHGIALEAVAMAQDCEIDGRASTGTVYWEGPVSLQGASEGAIAGEGYLEVTGRAGSLEARF
jgi:predicted secreted hydrolase